MIEKADAAAPGDVLPGAQVDLLVAGRAAVHAGEASLKRNHTPSTFHAGGRDLAAPHHTPDRSGTSALAVRRAALGPAYRVDARHKDVAAVYVVVNRAVRLDHRAVVPRRPPHRHHPPVTLYFVTHRLSRRVPAALTAVSFQGSMPTVSLSRAWCSSDLTSHQGHGSVRQEGAVEAHQAGMQG